MRERVLRAAAAVAAGAHRRRRRLLPRARARRRGRRRDRRVRRAAGGLAPLRRGRAGSTRSPSARGGSAPRSCSSRARARRAGAASSPPPRAARSRSGSRSDDRRGRLPRRQVEPLPRRAARALLPHARLGPGRRGRAAGGAAARWRGLPRFEGRSSLRSWLYTIATNACLSAIERRPKRVLPIDYGPAADPHDAPGRAARRVGLGRALPRRALGLDAAVAGPEARYEQRESVELAFIAALQHLPPRQRAVLILRDVLGFSGAEVADALDTTPASVYSALQRAHRTVDERLPDAEPAGDAARARRRRACARSSTATSRLGARRRRRASSRCSPRTRRRRCRRGRRWFRGRDAVAAFLTRVPVRRRQRGRGSCAAASTGSSRSATTSGTRSASAFVAHGVNVLTLAATGSPTSRSSSTRRCSSAWGVIMRWHEARHLERRRARHPPARAGGRDHRGRRRRGGVAGDHAAHAAAAGVAALAEAGLCELRGRRSAARRRRGASARSACSTAAREPLAVLAPPRRPVARAHPLLPRSAASRSSTSTRRSRPRPTSPRSARTRPSPPTSPPIPARRGVLCGDLNTPRREPRGRRASSRSPTRAAGSLRPERGERWDRRRARARAPRCATSTAGSTPTARCTATGIAKRAGRSRRTAVAGGSTTCWSTGSGPSSAAYVHEWRRERLSDHSALVVDLT